MLHSAFYSLLSSIFHEIMNMKQTPVLLHSLTIHHQVCGECAPPSSLSLSIQCQPSWWAFLDFEWWQSEDNWWNRSSRKTSNHSVLYFRIFLSHQSIRIHHSDLLASNISTVNGTNWIERNGSKNVIQCGECGEIIGSVDLTPPVDHEINDSDHKTCGSSNQRSSNHSNHHHERVAEYQDKSSSIDLSSIEQNNKPSSCHTIAMTRRPKISSNEDLRGVSLRTENGQNLSLWKFRISLGNPNLLGHNVFCGYNFESLVGRELNKLVRQFNKYRLLITPSSFSSSAECFGSSGPSSHHLTLSHQTRQHQTSQHGILIQILSPDVSIWFDVFNSPWLKKTPHSDLVEPLKTESSLTEKPICSKQTYKSLTNAFAEHPNSSIQVRSIDYSIFYQILFEYVSSVVS